jgi:hypothetical protein
LRRHAVMGSACNTERQEDKGDFAMMVSLAWADLPSLCHGFSRRTLMPNGMLNSLQEGYCVWKSTRKHCRLAPSCCDGLCVQHRKHRKQRQFRNDGLTGMGRPSLAISWLQQTNPHAQRLVKQSARRILHMDEPSKTLSTCAVIL